MSKQQKIDFIYQTLQILRNILIEENAGVPRYTIASGAALNHFVEEELSPALRICEELKMEII